MRIAKECEWGHLRTNRGYDTDEDCSKSPVYFAEGDVLPGAAPYQLCINHAEEIADEFREKVTISDLFGGRKQDFGSGR